jgi:hypothetical protein
MDHNRVSNATMEFIGNNQPANHDGGLMDDDEPEMHE